MTIGLRGRLQACAFVSGWAALVYEVLWLKDLGRLLGNSAHSASLILSAYFLGLAGGSFFFARRLRRRRATPATYAALEMGIAAGAVVFLVFLRGHDALFSQLYAAVPLTSFLAAILKFTVAGFFLWLPAFFMGATFPVLVDILAARFSSERGDPERLYFMNIMGGVLGALLAGFVLPRFLGFTASYALAIGANLAVAICAWLAPREDTSSPAPANGGDEDIAALVKLVQRHKAHFSLAFLSGFGALGLEVLWHQLFGLVTIHCVYSFAAILAVFLLALGGGALLARRVKTTDDPFVMVRRVLILIACCTAATPLLFYALTGGFTFAYQQESFAGYLVNLFAIAGGAFFIPAVALGVLFPLLFRAALGEKRQGAFLGALSGMNTLGAITGSLVAGFGLSRLGVVEGIFIIAGLYLIAMQLLIPAGSARRVGIVPLIVVSALFLLAKTLPLVPLSAAQRETLLSLTTGPYGMVAVIDAEPEIGQGKRVKDRFIRLNNFYTLGGVGSLHDERRQGELPLYFAPRAESIFFLGMGTGITAGGILRHPVKKVVVTEIVPEVVNAARDFFHPYVDELFTDPRVTVRAEDGRSVLAMQRDSYDVIVADLFDPWGAGIGTLYTRENFELIKSRLTPEGVFVQWLPLYQLTEEGFGIIARTMLDVFPHVVAWRGNYHPDKPTLALVAFSHDAVLDADALERRVAERGGDSPEQRFRVAETFLNQSEYAWQSYTAEKKAFIASLFPQVRGVFPFGFYVGNLGARREAFAGFPVNTLDHPVFEYLSPEFLGMQKNRAGIWMTGETLLPWLERLGGFEDDPYLSRLDARRKTYVAAGQTYYAYGVARYRAVWEGSAAQAEKAKELFRAYQRQTGLDEPR